MRLANEWISVHNWGFEDGDDRYRKETEEKKILEREENDDRRRMDTGERRGLEENGKPKKRAEDWKINGVWK